MIAWTRSPTTFVEHCATRWEAGKSMLVCIDKVTCALGCTSSIMPRWKIEGRRWYGQSPL